MEVTQSELSQPLGTHVTAECLDRLDTDLNTARAGVEPETEPGTPSSSDDETQSHHSDESASSSCRRRTCGCFGQSGRQGRLESLFAMATLGIVCGWFYIILTAFLGALAIAVWYQSIVAGTAAAVMLSSCWWPLNNRFPWQRWTKSYVFRSWRRYFDWTCVVEETLDPSRRYMFAEMPHGIVPLGPLVSVSVVQHAFPGLKHVSGVAASIVLRIPVIRQIYGWAGVREAGRESITQMFNDGVQVAVVVGGIAEMFLASHEEERVYLKRRKNFVKLAVQEGADIVPVFFFGNSLTFDLLGGGDANSWLKRLSRKCKSSLLVFYGRWGTTIPYRQPIKMTVGKPIRVTQQEAPEDEYVDSLHKELIARTEALYAKHKPDWEHRPLVIV